MLMQDMFFTREQYQEYVALQHNIDYQYGLIQQLFDNGHTGDRPCVYTLSPMGAPTTAELESLAPFARIRLVRPRRGNQRRPDVVELWALVVSVHGDQIDAYVLGVGDGQHGRLRISSAHVIECRPPISQGELDETSDPHFFDPIPF